MNPEQNWYDGNSEHEYESEDGNEFYKDIYEKWDDEQSIDCNWQDPQPNEEELFV